MDFFVFCGSDICPVNIRPQVFAQDETIAFAFDVDAQVCPQSLTLTDGFRRYPSVVPQALANSGRSSFERRFRYLSNLSMNWILPFGNAQVNR
jgi:hypothetical protein